MEIKELIINNINVVIIITVMLPIRLVMSYRV